MDKELKEFLGTIEIKIDGIKKNQEDQKLVLSALEERTKIDSAEIQNMKNRFDKTDARFDKMDESIENLKEDLRQTKQELKEDIRNTEVVLSNITSAINQDIAQIKEKFEDIREDVDVLNLKTDSNTKKNKKINIKRSILGFSFLCLKKL